MDVMVNGEVGMVKRISWYVILDFLPWVTQHLGGRSTWWSPQVPETTAKFPLESRNQHWEVTCYMLCIGLGPITATK
eukprot:11021908-Ditylum_brightwellii.AAC.1